MSDQNPTPSPASPFAYRINTHPSETTGLVTTQSFNLENGIVFLYNDKSALIIATRYDRDREGSTIDVIKQDELLEYFEFKNLAACGLLSRLYIIQEIGKTAGLAIVPTEEGGDTFRIELPNGPTV